MAILTVFSIEVIVIIKNKGMKFLIAIFIFLIVSANSFINSQATFFDNNWYNPYFKNSIRTKSYYDGIKVRGIYSGYNWAYFKRCGLNSYCDKYDNVLKFSYQNRMVYYDRRKRSKFTFYPSSQHARERYYDDSHFERNEVYSGRGSYESDRESVTLPDDKFKKDNPKENFDYKQLISPEGTWKVDDPDKLVLIVDTRDGIKARFDDDSKWYVYKNDPNKSGIYLSEAGHQYEYVNENTMIWKDKNGKRQYMLERMQDVDR